ncbi:MAG: prepilin peptidase [Verrucomicrobiales bacterium]|nr:prepilin peptidase [Verrucomicrobiales bacterium]|tara:strand:- start:15113 stop:16207 length:1095 start_codon:yes stop_codon:yes gene_type:complete
MEPPVNPYAAMPFHFWTATFFVFGTVVGSFLNVCIYRMPRELSIVSPPSHCPGCEYRIPWYQNIPILTWLMLAGRCANCRTGISPRYLLVELLTGCMFAGCWIGLGEQSVPVSIVACIFIAGLLAATFIDFEHFIIPNEITYGGMVVGVIASAAVPALHDVTNRATAMKESMIGVVVGAVVVLVVLQFGKILFGRFEVRLGKGEKMTFTETELHLPENVIPLGEIFTRKSDYIRFHARRLELVDRCHWDTDVELCPGALRIGNDTMPPESVDFMQAETDRVVLPREAMGFGDVKFMAAIGAFLGWKAVLFSLTLSSLVGSFVGVSLIILGKREWSSKLPYGPYIALAALVWLFMHEEMVARLGW